MAWLCGLTRARKIEDTPQTRFAHALEKVRRASANAADAKRNLDALTTPQADNGASPRPLQVLEINWKTGEFGNRVIQGTVRNNTGRNYKYVQVEINLYDDAGTQVGSTLANVNNLEPNAIWRFEAFVLQESATQAKVQDVTGF